MFGMFSAAIVFSKYVEMILRKYFLVIYLSDHPCGGSFNCTDWASRVSTTLATCVGEHICVWMPKDRKDADAVSHDMDKATYGLLINVLTRKFMAVDLNLLNLCAAVSRLANATQPSKRPRTCDSALTQPKFMVSGWPAKKWSDIKLYLFLLLAQNEIFMGILNSKEQERFTVSTL